MTTRDETIDLSPFRVGEGYSRKDVARLGGVAVPEAIYNSEWSEGIVEFKNAALLFGTFEKTEYQYRNEFEGSLFWWQTQNRQTQSSPLVVRIGDGSIPCFLFARVRAKTKGSVEPFVYCGALSRPEMEGARPVTCLFESLDYVEEATGPLAQIYGWRTEATTTAEEGQRRAAIKRKAIKGGQGALSDTELRVALELYGMTKAQDHYKAEGWIVEDTSKTNPYDLLCTRAGASRRVEVKATTTAGEQVLVTSGEVNSARDASVETDLFIVRNIQVTRDAGKRVLSGGEVQVISPWRPLDEHLSPTQFRYRVEPASD